MSFSTEEQAMIECNRFEHVRDLEMQLVMNA
jgi:hypothetical protein